MNTPREIIAAAMDDDNMMYQQDDNNADIIIDALNAAGYVIVPSSMIKIEPAPSADAMTEPTNAEIKAAAMTLQDYGCHNCWAAATAALTAAAAARPQADGWPTVREIALTLHKALSGGNPDKMIHHPAQKSWEVPSWYSWQQWEHAAEAVHALRVPPIKTPPGGENG